MSADEACNVPDVTCGGAGEFTNLYDFLAVDICNVGVVGEHTLIVDEEVLFDFDERCLHDCVV